MQDYLILLAPINEIIVASSNTHFSVKASEIATAATVQQNKNG